MKRGQSQSVPCAGASLLQVAFSGAEGTREWVKSSGRTDAEEKKIVRKTLARERERERWRKGEGEKDRERYYSGDVHQLGVGASHFRGSSLGAT